MVIVGLTLTTPLDRKRGILPWGNNTVGYVFYAVVISESRLPCVGVIPYPL